MANSMAKSLSLFDFSQLPYYGGKGNSPAAVGAAPVGDAPSALHTTARRHALLCSPMRLWGYRGDHQDSNVMDTTVLRKVSRTEEGPDGTDGIKQQSQDKEESPTSSGKDKSMKDMSTQQQKSQVALEVIKLRKELQRLKSMSQTKQTRMEMRDALEEQIRDQATARASPLPTAATGRENGASATDASSTASSASVLSRKTGATPATPHVATRLRFADPLVTRVSYRPYTDPEDIEKLYFIEEELNELEWDRQTVADDQYEVIMTPSAREVQIAHQKRRLLALHPQESLPHSMSDLSVY